MVIVGVVQQLFQESNADHGGIHQKMQVKRQQQNIQMEDLKEVITIVEIQMTILLYGAIQLIQSHPRSFAMELIIFNGKKILIVLQLHSI